MGSAKRGLPILLLMRPLLRNLNSFLVVRCVVWINDELICADCRVCAVGENAAVGNSNSNSSNKFASRSIVTHII